MSGIFSYNGTNPLDAFGLRLTFLGSESLSEAVRALLGGESVISTDGGLEVGVAQVDAEGWLLTVTMVGAPYKCEVALKTRVGGDGLGPLETFPIEPVPDQWCQVLSPTETRWQLVNVAIFSVAPVKV